MNRYTVGLLLTLSVLLSCSKQVVPVDTEIMYFILIDRFVDGDSSNNLGNNPASYDAYTGGNPEALKSYQGGDLAGISQSLDSLKSLGITIIWISPFLDNSNSDYVGWWPYHGYHPIDFYGVDEHYGTMSDLKGLVNKAHDLGLKIIFDMPFNQTAQDHPWIGDSSKADWFHRDANGNPLDITNWFDQEQIEKGELHGLPDLAQEHEAVTKYLVDVSKFWIDETGCDGFRLDAVKHIPVSFWQEYNAAMKAHAGDDFLLLGEVFWGDADRIKPYIDIGFDYLFDIPGYYAINNTINKGGSIKDFSNFYNKTRSTLSSTRFATLIDNHDVARFNVGLGDDAWSKQLLALGWIMTAPGLPVIYSGTEYGVDGYPVLNSKGVPQDFLNRIPYILDPEKKHLDRRKEFSELVQLRKQYPALNQGEFTEVYKDWSIYAYIRYTKNQILLAMMNNASTAEYIALPGIAGLTLKDEQPIYGDGGFRIENEEWWLRLPPNQLCLWELSGHIPASLPSWVTFTDRLSSDYQMIQLFYADPQKTQVMLQVAGDFNNWVPDTYNSHIQNDTTFIDFPLKPGHYHYKFVIDGEDWIADPNASSFSVDPYGGKNSVIVVK